MTVHPIRIGGIVIVLVAFMLYPFLPGSYDSLAAPLSTMVQAFGGVGLLLVPVGVIGLVRELKKRTRKKRNLPGADAGHWLPAASLIAATVVAIVVSLVGLGSGGVSVGCLTFALWTYVASKLMPALKRLEKMESTGVNPAPFYLIFIPTAVLAVQLIVAGPVTELSRNRAIRASRDLIREIEQHHTVFGRYPESLLAVNQDYHSSVVGIEQFHYAPRGDAYNLFFEQPRFVFDRIGTREFVVFNKLDEHVIPSHAAWNHDWPPERLSVNQGWYEAHDAGIPHWKYFWFD